MEKDYLRLKWGRLKSWCFNNSPESEKALEEYQILKDVGDCETIRQRRAICKIIDGLNGEISIWWTGEENVSKKDAKEYVMNYGLKEA